MKRVVNSISGSLGGMLRAARACYAVVPLALPVLLVSLSSTPTDRAAVLPSPRPTIEYSLLQDFSASPLPAHVRSIQIQKGDTLDSILLNGGLSREESARVAGELGKTVNPKSLKPGELIRFAQDASNEVTALEMRVAGWGTIQAARTNSGFEVVPIPAPAVERQILLSAKVETSLYDAICDRGEKAELVQRLVDVFQWDVDFFRLQRGDWFSLVVDKRFVGDDVIGYGPIVAARFHHNGNTFEAFRFEATDGGSGYYTARGTPVRKQFLKSPLKFSRITSGFSNRRFHPILRRFRPHHGVDYGAPTGTPVMSTADGVVVLAGHGRGEGNCVRIKHNAKIQTSYLHLSRFAKGLKRGTKVTQGEVIGYVGSTGLATAPHLDYRVSDGGKWLNPLQLRSITPDPLYGDALRRFRTSVARYVSLLDGRMQIAARTATSARALF